jgi:hypothetical protein
VRWIDIADYDLACDRGELEHLHADIPDAGREVHAVAAIFVGECRDFGVTLLGDDGGAGHELVGSANGSRALRAADWQRAQKQRNKQARGGSQAHGKV